MKGMIRNPGWYEAWTRDNKECPVAVWRATIGLSRLALAQVVGIAASTVADQEAGRRPTIHGALLRTVPDAERDLMVAAYAEWFGGLGQEARDRAARFAEAALVQPGVEILDSDAVDAILGSGNGAGKR